MLSLGPLPSLPDFPSTNLKLVVQLSSSEVLSPYSTQGEIYDRSTKYTPREKGHAEQCSQPSVALCPFSLPGDVAIPGLAFLTSQIPTTLA